MPEEFQDVRLKVSLLEQEVGARGKQIDALLKKLDTTADKILELTVEIKTLNARQKDHLTHDNAVRDELRLLHTRVGTVHDAVEESERRIGDKISEIDRRVRSIEQFKSRLMGMTTIVAAVIGAVTGWIVSMMKGG